MLFFSFDKLIMTFLLSKLLLRCKEHAHPSNPNLRLRKKLIGVYYLDDDLDMVSEL